MSSWFLQIDLNFSLWTPPVPQNSSIPPLLPSISLFRSNRTQSSRLSRFCKPSTSTFNRHLLPVFVMKLRINFVDIAYSRIHFILTWSLRIKLLSFLMCLHIISFSLLQSIAIFPASSSWSTMSAMFRDTFVDEDLKNFRERFYMLDGPCSSHYGMFLEYTTFLHRFQLLLGK